MKKLLPIIISLVLILTLSACKKEKSKTPEIILKASFSSPMDTFAYCFELTDDKFFTTKYGRLQTDNLKSDNYILRGKEEQIKLSDEQYSELLRFTDNLYNARSTLYGDGTDGAVNIDVLYKDTEILTCYDIEPIVVKAFGEKLIELSPLTVDFSIQNGAELDVENCEWVSENPPITLKKIESSSEEPNTLKFYMTVKRDSGEEEYLLSLDGLNGNYSSDGEYKCLFYFTAEDIENSDVIFLGDGEYLGDKIVFNEWGEDNLFNYEYQVITFERVKL